MNMLVAICLSGLVPIVAVIGAVLMALRGVDGWGWFLLVALISGVSFTTKKEKEK